MGEGKQFSSLEGHLVLVLLAFALMKSEPFLTCSYPLPLLCPVGWSPHCVTGEAEGSGAVLWVQPCVPNLCVLSSPQVTLPSLGQLQLLNYQHTPQTWPGRL